MDRRISIPGVKLWSTVVIAAILLALSGDAIADDSRPIKQLTLFPEQFVLTSGRAAQRLSVTGLFADSLQADVTDQVGFESLDPAIASVSSSGVVTPHADGQTEIVARLGSLEARTIVVVSDSKQHPPIDFYNEIIPALSRGGCSQGACHGSPQGKNGFRLSLRGFDPSVDLRSLTRDDLGRRLNLLEPAESLLLRKATGKVAHQGGVRLKKEDPAYRVLLDWIAQGAKDIAAEKALDRVEVFPRLRRLDQSTPKQQIVVRAHYTDGTAQDVTDLASFSIANEETADVSEQGLVAFDHTAEAVVLIRFLDRIETVSLTYVQRDHKFNFASPQPANYVDELVFAKQKSLQLRPAKVASDAVFLRRIYLDLIGGIPAPDESLAFLDSSDPQKRAKLIDQLLDRKEYATFWALKWADIMQGNRETISERGVHSYHRYLIRQFNDDRSFDQFVREILTSQGNTVHQPEANFFRISRTPNDAAEAFSQIFLGVRIQCAKCHNHPYESITQKDYYSLAAHFSRVKLKSKRFGLDDEIVFLSLTGEVSMPDHKEALAPAAFGHATAEVKDEGDRRERLADWLTIPENRYFAGSTVNRIWNHLMGQGLVEPVDDFRSSNPASNPELLDALTEQFVKDGYRFKSVIRTILNSQTYQLGAEFEAPQSMLAADASRYFTQPVVRMLTAEQIIDSISTATGVAERYPGYPLGSKAIELAEGGVEHKFLEAFTKPVRDVVCDCARETEPTFNQVVHLINNPSILDKIDSPKSRLAAWLAEKKSDTQIVESLYLAALCRRPTQAEQQIAANHLAAAKTREAGLRDLSHALLNSNEFLLRH